MRLHNDNGPDPLLRIVLWIMTFLFVYLHPYDTTKINIIYSLKIINLFQSHSGLLNGGHYISYACNPNGHWYCYNDSSCREVLTEVSENTFNKSTSSLSSKGSGSTPLSRRKNVSRKLSTGSNVSNTSDDHEKKEKIAPLATSDAYCETQNSSR